MIDIDRFQEILDTIFHEQPECCLEELNGGVCLLPECKMSPQAVDDDLYVLGEFCHSSSMGRYINIYYGSFAELFGYMNETRITEKIREVLQHEIYHHLESLSGTHELEDEDERFMQRYFAEKRRCKK
jgi:hypothetical protein